MSNRKLKRGVYFTSVKAYNHYQTICIEWYIHRTNCTENEAVEWWIETGFAEAFRQHHGQDGTIEINHIGA